jgi:hypothetical protein
MPLEGDTMHTQPRLASNYAAIQFWQSREMTGPRAHQPNTRISTFQLDYYVEYVNMDENGKFHTGLKHVWNCQKDGFPSAHALRKFMARKDVQNAASNAELITVMGFIRRTDTGEVVEKYAL